MTASPIASWQTEWAKVGAVTDFLFLGSEMIAAMKSEDDYFLVGKQ